MRLFLIDLRIKIILLYPEVQDQSFCKKGVDSFSIGPNPVRTSLSIIIAPFTIYQIDCHLTSEIIAWLNSENLQF
jgi:hypothetical protein